MHLFISLLSLVIATACAKTQPLTPRDTIQAIQDVADKVRQDYAEDVPEDKLLKGALNGMLTELDPHSSYLDPKEFEDLRSHTQGKFGGIGIEVTMEHGVIKVVAPLDDTPAFKAGIKEGDYIISVDKKPILGQSLSEAVEKMKGEPKTKVLLTVKREGKDPFDVKLTREMITVKSVKWRKEGNAGYIRIATFSENTTDLLKEAISALKKELGDKIEGIVIDLRNNAGGLLEQAITVSEQFIDKGEIVSTRGKDVKKNIHIQAQGKDVLKGLPLVILVNGGSASASEIVAGALQDHRRAIIVGTKTFGKGSVQTLIPMTNGGAIKLTTARYYTPKGRSIQSKGIEPDILVEQAANLEALKEDERIREKDFKGALAAEEPSKEDETDPSVEKKKTEKIPDYQLLRAMDILKAQFLTKKG